MNVLSQIINLENLEKWVNLNCASLDKLPCYIFMKDRKGAYLNTNDKMAQTAGLSKTEDMLGLHDKDLCWEKHASLIVENDRLVVKTAKPHLLIEPTNDYNHTHMVCTAIKAPLRNKFKKVIGMIGASFLHQNDLFGLSVLSSDKSLQTDLNKLSKRQKECLFYLTKGMSIKQIGSVLKISPRTVEDYLSIIKNKLGCYTTAQLIERVHLDQL